MIVAIPIMVVTKVRCGNEANSMIMTRNIMQEPIRISLRYDGPDVISGEMNIDEVISALQGFSSAYAKVASEVAPNGYQELKVTAIQPGSFDILIVAAVYIMQTGDALEHIETVVNAAKFTFEIITQIIGLKKHVKSNPYTTQINGQSHNITVINADKVELTLSLPAFEMYKDKTLDDDIEKITAPLCEGRIEVAKLQEIGNDSSEVVVTSDEREFFRSRETTSVEEREISGTLVSLNKKTNRGTFEFGNGKTARYFYIGVDKDSFHSDFSRKGPVSVIADVAFDENLTVTHLDIKSVKPLQSNLELHDRHDSSNAQESPKD